MSIEKSLYAAPQGLAGEPISVEIVDPEEVHIEGPGFEMHMEKGKSPEFDANLAEDMDESVLSSIAYDLLGDVTKDEADQLKFKVPMLRNIALTAPYFHDGSVASLDEAVREMGWLQLGRKFTDDETHSLVAFLNTLTDKERARHHTSKSPAK